MNNDTGRSQYVSEHDETHPLALYGCRPEPLAHYLKALGILRLVAEQKDSRVRGYWNKDAFYIESSLDRDGLLKFFLEEYRPTPIVAPWNGGSGFFEKDNQKAILSIEMSDNTRFSEYRNIIQKTRSIMKSLGISGKSRDEIVEKDSFLRQLRAQLPYSVIDWLDAAFVLIDETTKYPPLLGTGGNDGRLDFTNNFMQRLIDIFEVKNDDVVKSAEGLLKYAVFERPVAGLQKGSAIGQFYPGAAGGVNLSSGYSSDSLINPWDFVLMIEGTMIFGSVSTKRLSLAEPGTLAYPFTVRQTGAGYESASGADESSRGEMWMPLWGQPATFRELRKLLSEGRGQVCRRSVKTGSDFARSVSELGVDRGINGFVRYGFQIRNGLAYFATPLGRWNVEAQPAVRLIDELDGWLESMRRAANAKNSPARIGVALRTIENAIFNLCRHGGKSQLQKVLCALGAAEMALNKSRRFCKDKNIKPIQPLNAGWLEQSDDNSFEFAIAASLSSIYSESLGSIRSNVEAVEIRGDKAFWSETGDPPCVVWGEGDFCRNLIRIMTRRCIDAEQQGEMKFPIWGKRPLELQHIAAFLNGGVDLKRVADLFIGLMLIDWRRAGCPVTQEISPIDLPLPDARYALLKLCFLPDRGKRLLERELPCEKAILSRLGTGDLQNALTMAARRLRGGGIRPRFETAQGSTKQAIALAASLILPIGPYAEKWIFNRVHHPKLSDN